MAEAALAAFNLLGDQKYLAVFHRAYGWFHGQSNLHEPLVDVVRAFIEDDLEATRRDRGLPA